MTTTTPRLAVTHRASSSAAVVPAVVETDRAVAERRADAAEAGRANAERRADAAERELARLRLLQKS